MYVCMYSWVGMDWGLGEGGCGVGMMFGGGIGARGRRENKRSRRWMYTSWQRMAYIHSKHDTCMFFFHKEVPSPDVKKSVHRRHCACGINNGMHRKKNIDIDIDIVEPYNCFFFFFFFFFSHAGNAERKGQRKRKTMQNEMKS